MKNPFHVVAQAQKKFKKGDKAYVVTNRPLPGMGKVGAGTEVVLLDDGIYHAQGTKVSYKVQVVNSSLVLRLNEEYLIGQKPVFHPGDQIMMGGTAPGQVKSIIEFSGQYNQWRYELDMVTGGLTTATEGSLSKPTQQTQQPQPQFQTEKTKWVPDQKDKDQLSDRIYDLYFQKTEPSSPNEMSELLAQWKEMTGQDAPRFISGQQDNRDPWFDKFFMSYIATALWSTTDERHEEFPELSENLDGNFDGVPADFAGDLYERLRQDAKYWYDKYSYLFDGSEGRAGHDFWLTRNGHGAGFWDGDWQEPAATMLTEASRQAGEINIGAFGPPDAGVIDLYDGNLRGSLPESEMYSGDETVIASKNPFHVVKAQPSTQRKFRPGQKVWSVKDSGPNHMAGDEYTIIAPFGPHPKYEAEDSLGKRFFVEEKNLTDQQPKYMINDIVDDPQAPGTQSEITNMFFDQHVGAWRYHLVMPGGAGTSWQFELDIVNHQSAMQQSPQTAGQKARFKRGDKAYIARPRQHRHKGGDGKEVTIVSDPQQRPNSSEIEYYVQEPGKSAKLWPDKWLTPQKPKYAEGDRYTDYATETGTIGPIDYWDEHNGEWVYEVDVDSGGTDSLAESEFLSVQTKQPRQKPDKTFEIGDYVNRNGDLGVITGVHPDSYGKVRYVVQFNDHKGQSWELTKYGHDLEKASPPKFQPGDVVQGIAAKPDNPNSAKVLKPVSYQGGWAYELQWNHGPDTGVIIESQLKLKQKTQQQQLDERQSGDPEAKPRSEFHPSQQELMSHIKDTGTPYFPPTPEGMKAWEEYLIRQHSKEMEEMKKNWGMLIKKFGKKGQLMVRKQKDALYVHAMKYARKDV